MTPEPLKDQIENLIVKYTDCSGANGSFIAKEILKLFNKLIEEKIQIHEEKIEELIKELILYSDKPTNNSIVMMMISREYESIMILEAGLEDVI